MNERELRKQLQTEIDWLKEKIKTVRKERHKRDLDRQIKEREYKLHLSDFKNKSNE